MSAILMSSGSTTVAQAISLNVNGTIPSALTGSSDLLNTVLLKVISLRESHALALASKATTFPR